jgi:hypothetical protein
MRRFRTLPIGDKPVWIELLLQQVFCLLRGFLRQVKVLLHKEVEIAHDLNIEDGKASMM